MLRALRVLALLGCLVGGTACVEICEEPESSPAGDHFARPLEPHEHFDNRGRRCTDVDLLDVLSGS